MPASCSLGFFLEWRRHLLHKKMARLWYIVLVVLAACNAVANGGAAPSPSSYSDCSDLIYDMVDCVPYVREGSDEAIPDGSCCSAFEAVLAVDRDCVCEALTAGGSMGIQFDLAKAMTLPAACGVSAPPLHNCAVIPPSPSASSSSGEEAPAPSSLPMESAAYYSSASFSLICFIMASLSYILV